MPFTFYVNRYRVTRSKTHVTYTPAEYQSIEGYSSRAVYDARPDTITKVERTRPKLHRVKRRPVNT